MTALRSFGDDRMTAVGIAVDIAVRTFADCDPGERGLLAGVDAS
jgi:hypothetical protein